MTFERAVQIHSVFLTTIKEDPTTAQSRILEFLDWTEPDEEAFAADTRIVLVAGDFGKELTTSVMWLNDHDVDIKCVRMKPYRDGARTLIDVQQIIPLPEATDYQIQLREKKTKGREQGSARHNLRQQFWDGVVAWSKKKGGRHANLKTGSYSWIGAGSGIRGLGWNLAVQQSMSKAELYIDRGNKEANKSIFDQLLRHRAEIEAACPLPIEWQRLDDKRASRVKTVIPGGYRTSPTEWPAIQEKIVDATLALEKTLSPFIKDLQF